MQKIISLFQRNYNSDYLVRDEIVPGAEWVIACEGIPTRKFDGTCCMIKEGRLFKRHDVKAGKAAPAGFIPAQQPDPNTGHWPGWLEIGAGPEDAIHREAYRNSFAFVEGEGTYELIGPSINKNPDKATLNVLMKHGSAVLENVPRDYVGLKKYFETVDIEGIVWHHPDGRMVKIKKKDFGFKR